MKTNGALWSYVDYKWNC